MRFFRRNQTPDVLSDAPVNAHLFLSLHLPAIALGFGMGVTTPVLPFFAQSFGVSAGVTSLVFFASMAGGLTASHSPITGKSRTTAERRDRRAD